MHLLAHDEIKEFLCIFRVFGALDDANAAGGNRCSLLGIDNRHMCAVRNIFEHRLFECRCNGILSVRERLNLCRRSADDLAVQIIDELSDDRRVAAEFIHHREEYCVGGTRFSGIGKSNASTEFRIQ